MKDRLTLFEVAEIKNTRGGDGYEALEAGIRQEFAKNIVDSNEPLFETYTANLFDTFLANLPEEARQHYNCNACRKFVNRFGGLVRIAPDGHTVPVMWPVVEGFFAKAVDAVLHEVSLAPVTGMFVPDGKRLGTPVTGDWHHMAVELPRERWHKDKLRTAHQAAADKAEDHRLLCEAVGKYSTDTMKAALNLLRSGSLYRSDRVEGIAKWFFNVHESTQRRHNAARRNLLWLAAATAPTGFCHISGSVLGTLLDDIAAGLDTETIKRRFREKMDPLQYQRPQAAPSAGNIAEAERIVKKLGVADSLHRRFARLEELELLWKPAPVEAPAAGVFAHLLPKQPPLSFVEGPTLTWEKFSRTVLPDARKIEFLTRDAGVYDFYTAITTAVDPDAPPILQWDTEEKRNPFCWYMYACGSPASAWSLPHSSWIEVTGITLQPNLWQPGFEYQGKGVVFLLKGCKDTRFRNGGLALFPETLKSELRAIRATIEAYSRAGTLSGHEGATACGIRIQAGHTTKHRFRVYTDLGVTEYTIDRWD